MTPTRRATPSRRSIRRGEQWRRAAMREPNHHLALAYAAEARVFESGRAEVPAVLTPPCQCCGRRPGCGEHHAATPEDWDPIVGAGCLCPEVKR